MSPHPRQEAAGDAPKRHGSGAGGAGDGDAGGSAAADGGKGAPQAGGSPHKGPQVQKGQRPGSAGAAPAQARSHWGHRAQNTNATRGGC